MTTSVSKQSKLLSALQRGAEFTPRQITASFGLRNPHDAVHNLRRQGYCVYANPRADGGVKYRLGTPSRQMIALATIVGGSALFTR